MFSIVRKELLFRKMLQKYPDSVLVHILFFGNDKVLRSIPDKEPAFTSFSELDDYGEFEKVNKELKKHLGSNLGIRKDLFD